MKRKYTRKAPQSKSSLSKGESSSLPPNILESIKITLEHRKVLGLYDDPKERIERALSYQEFLTKRQV